MNFSYYPGCTLKTKAKELDAYARKSAEALGVVMEELEDWQCKRKRVLIGRMKSVAIDPKPGDLAMIRLKWR